MKGKIFNMKVINVHAPTKGKEEEIKEEFYTQQKYMTVNQDMISK
jgi:hypothetical protein